MCTAATVAWGVGACICTAATVARGSGVLGVSVGTLAAAVGALGTAVAWAPPPPPPDDGADVAVAGTEVAVGVAVAGTEVAVGAAAVMHEGAVMVFVSIVTAPFRARARPVKCAPVFSVMLVSATMFPTNVLPVSRVAELVTCQKILHSLAPGLVTITVDPELVINVLGLRKVKLASVTLPAFRVSVPVRLDAAAGTQ